jgi:hypothetical protein
MTERTFIVRTRLDAIEVPSVADVSIGARGELVCKDADDGCVAIFAPGEWLSAVLADEREAD